MFPALAAVARAVDAVDLDRDPDRVPVGRVELDRGDAWCVDELAFGCVAERASGPRVAAVARAIDLGGSGSGIDHVRVVRCLRDLKDMHPVHRRGQVGPALVLVAPAVDALIGAGQDLARTVGMRAHAPAARFVVDPAGVRVGAVPALARVVAEPDRVPDRGGISGDGHRSIPPVRETVSPSCGVRARSAEFPL